MQFSENNCEIIWLSLTILINLLLLFLVSLQYSFLNFWNDLLLLVTLKVINSKFVIWYEMVGYLVLIVYSNLWYGLLCEFLVVIYWLDSFLYSKIHFQFPLVSWYTYAWTLYLLALNSPLHPIFSQYSCFRFSFAWRISLSLYSSLCKLFWGRPVFWGIQACDGQERRLHGFIHHLIDFDLQVNDCLIVDY